MDLTGQQRIEAPRARVWVALNDPEVLRRCIPGCKSLEQISPTEMKATAGVKIGPIGATFTGDVTLSELDPPNGYRINGEGSGGAAGFAKGGATVRLSDEGSDATLLEYQVNAQVGGKLAQLGGPIIDATAKQLAGQFFRALAKEMAALPEPTTTELPPVETVPAPAAMPSPDPQPSPAQPSLPSRGSGGPPLAWPLATLSGGLLGFILGRSASGWDASGAWPGLAIGLTFVVVASAAFALGKGAAR